MLDRSIEKANKRWLKTGGRRGRKTRVGMKHPWRSSIAIEARRNGRDITAGDLSSNDSQPKN